MNSRITKISGIITLTLIVMAQLLAGAGAAPDQKDVKTVQAPSLLSSVVMSYDGKVVAASTLGGSIQVYFVDQNAPFLNGTGEIMDMVMNDNGKFLVRVVRGGLLNITDPTTGTSYQHDLSAKGDTAYLRVGISGDGNKLFCSVGSSITKFNFISVAHVIDTLWTILPPISGAITALAVSPDGGWLAAGTSTGNVYRINSSSGASTNVTNSGKSVRAVGISINGANVAYALNDRVVFTDSTLKGSWSNATTGSVTNFKLARNGANVFYSVRFETSSQVFLYRGIGGDGNATWAYTVGGADAYADLCAFNGTYMIGAGQNGKVFFFDAGNGVEPVWQWTNSNGNIAGVAISGNGSICAAITADSKLCTFPAKYSAGAGDQLNITSAHFSNAEIMPGLPVTLKLDVNDSLNEPAVGVTVRGVIQGTKDNDGSFRDGYFWVTDLTVQTDAAGDATFEYWPPTVSVEHTVRMTFTASGSGYLPYIYNLTTTIKPGIVVPPTVNIGDLNASYRINGSGNLSVEVLTKGDMNFMNFVQEFKEYRGDIDVIDLYAEIELPSTATLTWINITLDYKDVTLPKNVKENDLRLYYWDESSKVWVLVSNSGVDIGKNIIWGNVTHLTKFTGGAKPAVSVNPPSGMEFLSNPLFIGAMVVVIVGVPIGVILVRRKPKGPQVPRGQTGPMAPSVTSPPPQVPMAPPASAPAAPPPQAPPQAPSPGMPPAAPPPAIPPASPPQAPPPAAYPPQAPPQAPYSAPPPQQYQPTPPPYQNAPPPSTQQVQWAPPPYQSGPPPMPQTQAWSPPPYQSGPPPMQQQAPPAAPPFLPQPGPPPMPGPTTPTPPPGPPQPPY